MFLMNHEVKFLDGEDRDYLQDKSRIYIVAPDEDNVDENLKAQLTSEL